MVTWFYFIVFVLSLVMMGSFLFRNKNVDTLFILFSLMVTLNCMGRYMLAISHSLETAIWANRILYVGGCFTPLLTVFVLARLCNQRIPRVMAVLMVLYSTIVLALVMTIGKCGIYYEHVELAQGNGYSYLVKTYGPLHILYPVMMIMYSAIMLFYVVLAIRRRKQFSFQIVVTLSVSCFSVMFMYVLERVLRSNISFLSVGYLIGIALLIKYFERINIYDMSSNVAQTMERLQEYGYMVFDDKYKYVNANAYLKEVFPEVNDWEVDKEVPASDSYLYREVVEYLYHWTKGKDGTKTIQVNDSFFEMDIREISYGRKSGMGYLVELIDRTLEKKYYNAIEITMWFLKKKWQRKRKTSCI